MSRQPFIVTLAGPMEDFRRTLASAIPEATFIRELSGGRAVVAVPVERRVDLQQFPDVASVQPDELRKLLRPGRSGETRD